MLFVGMFVFVYLISFSFNFKTINLMFMLNVI